MASEMSRLFIGIPIDDDCQQQLDTLLLPLQAQWPGLRWQSRDNRHLTLAFLGEVGEEHAQRLLQAAPLPVVPFELALTAITRFPGAQGRILAATGAATQPLLALHRQLEQWLADCSVTYADQGRPLLPHVTLARLPAAFDGTLPLLRMVLALQVTWVHLYVSEQVDGRRVYRVLR